MALDNALEGRFVEIPSNHILHQQYGYSVLITRSAKIRDTKGKEATLPAGFLCDGASSFPDAGSAWAWHDYYYAKQHNKSEADDLISDIWRREGGLLENVGASAFESTIVRLKATSAYDSHKGKPLPIMSSQNGTHWRWHHASGDLIEFNSSGLRQRKVYGGDVDNIPSAPLTDPKV